MIILWIQKMKKDSPHNKSKKDSISFQEHDDLMKQFRTTHPDLDIIGVNDILTTDGNLLAPVQSIKLREHVQN